MKKWTVIGLMLTGALLIGAAIWFLMQKSPDAPSGVQMTPPLQSGDPSQDDGSGVEEFEDGMEAGEEMSNTFEMSGDGEGGPEDDTQMGQEIDGASQSDENKDDGLGGLKGVETIDDEDGETIDPASPVGHSSGGTGTETNSQTAPQP